jgi:multiple sugar transport system substrate-binding protein
MPKEWLQSVIDSAKISKLGLPVIIPVAEFRDLVGAASPPPSRALTPRES